MRVRLGAVRLGQETVSVFWDPEAEDSGSFDSSSRELVVRERDIKHAIHELFHMLVWAHCLSDVFRKGGEEALCGAMEISWMDAERRLLALFRPEASDD
jgi:hypothetical protein